MLFILYLVVKFGLYYSVCYWALTLFNIHTENKNIFAGKWALVRMLIGFAFGFLMVYVAALLSQSGLLLFWIYLLVFVIIRLLEWFVVYWLMAGLYQFNLSVFKISAIKWILVGAFVSMLLDMGLLALGEEYKFGIC